MSELWFWTLLLSLIKRDLLLSLNSSAFRCGPGSCAVKHTIMAEIPPTLTNFNKCFNNLKPFYTPRKHDRAPVTITAHGWRALIWRPGLARATGLGGRRCRAGHCWDSLLLNHTADVSNRAQIHSAPLWGGWCVHRSWRCSLRARPLCSSGQSFPFLSAPQWKILTAVGCY